MRTFLLGALLGLTLPILGYFALSAPDTVAQTEAPTTPAVSAASAEPVLALIPVQHALGDTRCRDEWINPVHIIKAYPHANNVTDSVFFGVWPSNCEKSATVEGTVIIVESDTTGIANEYLYNGSFDEFRADIAAKTFG